MALNYYDGNNHNDIVDIYHRINNTDVPISTLYQYINGVMVPVWEQGNLRTKDGFILVTKDNYIINVTDNK